MSIPPGNGKVIVVDDDESIRFVISRALEKEGFSTQPLGTGAEAIQSVKSAPASVYILDLKLPDMSGLDLLARIHEIQPAAKAVILTGYGEMDSFLSAQKLGAVEYVNKPADLDLIIRIVRRMIS